MAASSNDPFADPAAILRAALPSFLPAQQISVDQWAATRRWVSGARAGLWRHETAPYLVEPMQALTSGRHTTVVIPGPGQCGKTAVAENFLGHAIETDPAPFGWYLNTESVMLAYVKDKITGIVESHPNIAERLGREKTDNSLSFKRFRGMTAQFLAAVGSNLRNKTFQRIVADEIDGYDPAFGDPKTMLDVRRTTYGRDSMLLMLSHPDLATGSSPDEWQRGIMATYKISTRCTWWWPCAQCGAWISPNPGTARFCALVYPEDAPLDKIRADAHLLCPVNGCIIDDQARLAMNQQGRWIGHGQTIDQDGTITGERAPNDIAGFWIVGVMSPFLLDGLGGLAAARVQAERNMLDAADEKSVREVMSKQWGIPLDRKRAAGQLDAQVLADRAAEEAAPLGIVPDGVRFLTAGVDVQANRFELLVRGWGGGAESWVIDHQRIEADPATNPADWDALLHRLATAAYPLDDDSGRAMRLRAAGFDSAGEPGVTEQAYAAWRRAQRARHTRRLGSVAGRDCWTILPLKGVGTPNAKRLQVVYPDTARKDRRAAARGEIPVGLFGTNLFKDALAGQLGIAEPGPGFVHIPASLARAAAPTFFDQLTAETRGKTGAWSLPSGRRNEALDLMVMTAVMAHLHGLARLQWDRPPAWAAIWDSNTMITDTADSHDMPEPPRTPPIGRIISAPISPPRLPATPIAPQPFNPARKRSFRDFAAGAR